MADSLWGEDFEIKSTPKTAKGVIDRVNNPKVVKTSKDVSLKSKKLSLEDKLTIIKENVEKYLGVYKSSTLVIRDKEEFVNYIDKAIQNGVIAIDTETNNSLDPLTCKIMGACIYTPGMKNVYIPINHVNKDTKVRLENQLTEEDIKEQFDRLKDTKILMHNGKFDYKVIKCTCDCELSVYWDSMIAAKVLDENEKSAGLKQQYIEKIDSSIEKYSIDKLFEQIEYAVVDPDLFALYAATDAYMTYKLYEYQYNILSQEENKRLFDLLLNVEMPISIISAEMELTGVCIDVEYGKRLSAKYNKELENLDIEIDEELKRLQPTIDEWRKTPEANMRYIVDKVKKKVIFVPPSQEAEYGSKVSLKTMNEQLNSPPVLTSSLQLAILLYDVLKVPMVSKDNFRKTGEDVLEKIDLPLCDLILQKRGLIKLINTYIDKLPECLSPRDNRLHAKFDQYGAKTGRFSSKDPNLQNIPSKNNAIRMMFTASDYNYETEIIDNKITISNVEEVLTNNGWKFGKDLLVGEYLLNDEGQEEILSIDKVDNNYIIQIKEVM